MRRKWLRIILVLATIVVVAVFVGAWIQVSRHFAGHQLSADVFMRGQMVSTLGRVMDEEVLAKGAPIPESVDGLREFFEKDENLVQLLRKDERTHRMFSRAILLRDVNTSEGERYNGDVLSCL